MPVAAIHLCGGTHSAMSGGAAARYSIKEPVGMAGIE